MTSIVKEWEKLLQSHPLGIGDAYQKYKRTLEVLTTDADPEVGQTPKEVIWTKNKTKLYRYISKRPQKYKTPLLMIYALINKSYILDIKKGNSFIEYLVNEGFDVYLLDWGTPGLEDSHLKLDDYIIEYMPRAVGKVLRTSKADEISILGYCMGGTMTAIFASIYTHLPIRNLIFMTSPFDFADTGLYANFVDERYFNVDKAVDVLGNIPPEMIDFGNKMLKPITNFYGPYKSLLENSTNDSFVTNWKYMQKWVGDGIPFPGEAYRQWIKDFYQQNKLINGQLEIRGRRVDLRQINANVLNISAERDHIAMPHQVEALMNVISSKDKQYEVMPTGHVSVCFGPKAKKKTYPTVKKWLASRSK
ncbi:class III poly(R)-hydroxyalkanoic acid synthase subunit PhaC [Anaerobacillus sp. MEB173]|uniref:class III poly(R)-hydroxyalkanoic acid synthase subunit PhaC n=1 Tax=Anaerobacillus sp. MEB173 TaxID=3383345 RepID=UPI003F926431